MKAFHPEVMAPGSNVEDVAAVVVCGLRGSERRQAGIASLGDFHGTGDVADVVLDVLDVEASPSDLPRPRRSRA